VDCPPIVTRETYVSVKKGWITNGQNCVKHGPTRRMSQYFGMGTKRQKFRIVIDVANNLIKVCRGGSDKSRLRDASLGCVRCIEFLYYCFRRCI